jgi:hypothetical protein
LPDGKIWTQFSASIQISGGRPPYNSALGAGMMPPGLSIGERTGLITGMPVRANSYSFAVVATDSAGSSVAKNESITITQ